MNDRLGIEEALLESAAYPWLPDSVSRIDTHLSRVFLAGNRVVKIKRPVDLGFVDFRSLESRRQSCVDEVRLNRDLTTNVYLDVVPVTQIGDRLTVGGHGPAVEWATLMRRLPANQMLNELIARGETPSDLGLLLAEVLIPFHRSRAGTCLGAADETEFAASAVVSENIAQLRPFVDSVLDPDLARLVTGNIESFIDSRHQLLVDRASHGWIREGHGDLRAEHICIEPDGAVQVFDCVEFSQSIRCADVASDLGFLLMDLRRLGERDHANQLLERYRSAEFDLPDQLIRFYRAHRALVRAKVAGLTIDAAVDADRSRLLSEAAEYLAEATAATLSVQPMIIALSGLSGTGKSTVARAISRCIDIDILSSDQIRKEIAGVEGSAAAGWEQGIYSADWTERTYAEIESRASQVLDSGRPVMIDASYLEAEHRGSVAALAASHQVRLCVVQVTCDPAIVERRLRERSRSGMDLSDANVDIFRAQLARWTATEHPRLPGVTYLSIDTSGNAPVRVGALVVALAESGLVTAGF